MKRIWRLGAAILLLTGCGVPTAGVTDAGQAPTGVAPGTTLYFVDSAGELQPQVRDTDRLGTIVEAMGLLLAGPGESDLRTEIASSTMTMVEVTTSEDVIMLRVPLAAYEVTPLGIDQIVCTALSVHWQSGGPRSTKVQVAFTLPTPESDKLRTCPAIE